MEAKKRNQVLTILFFGVLMGALDIAIVGPAMPAIKKEFSEITERTLAWMFSVYVLFNLIGTPLMAKLSDMFGRRAIYVLDVSLFALGSLVVALSPSFGFVLLGRGIQGFGAGGIFPVASAVIGDTFPPEKRGSALGLIGAVFGLAFIVGPVLGGVILSLATWHWLFLINLPVAAVIILFSFRLLPSIQQNQTTAFDLSGMVVISLMLASLSFGLNQIDTTHFFSSLLGLNVLPFLLSSVVLGIILSRIERRAVNPILPPGLFQVRQLRLGYMLSSGAGLGEASLVFMPLLAVASLGNIQASQASFLLMPVVLAMAVGSPLVGRLLDRIGSKLVILGGTMVLTVGVFLLSQFASLLPLFILSGALIGLGLSALLGAPIRYITLNEVSAAERSVAQGVVTVFTSLGQLVGSALVGAIVASRGGGFAGYSTAFLVISLVGLLMIGAAVGLKSRDEETASRKSSSEEPVVEKIEALQP
jgi:EmrB/QacA subfamily drug resistance transporter